MLVDGLETVFHGLAPVVTLQGTTEMTSNASEGAAIIANGLAGGNYQKLIRHLRLHEAGSSIFDFLPSVNTATRRDFLEG